MFDEENSINGDRYDTTGGISLTPAVRGDVIGDVMGKTGRNSDILFAVYTKRIAMTEDGRPMDAARLISARMAAGLEGGCSMANLNDPKESKRDELVFMEAELQEPE